jgi:hypothetical protein
MEPGMGHESDGIVMGLFWPVTVPFVLVRAHGNPAEKRGRAAIDRYWQEKETAELNAHIEKQERELLGVNHVGNNR